MASVPSPRRWPPWAVLAGVGAVVALTVAVLLRYRELLSDPDAPLFLTALGVLLLGYVALAARQAAARPGGQAAGAAGGALAGMLWTAEIWAGGPAMLGRTGERLVGGSFAVLAVAVTVGVGVAAGLRRRDPGTAARAGLFAGLVSGVVVYVAATLMTLATLDVLGTRADYRAQFGASRAPDMATFLAGDILAATISHLLINLVLGLAGGAVGAVLAAAATGTRAPGPRPTGRG